MKKGIARQLRCWADMLDPPRADNAKRSHPATKNPAELKDIGQVKSVTGKCSPDAPRATKTYLPGEWGGP